MDVKEQLQGLTRVTREKKVAAPVLWALAVFGALMVAWSVWALWTNMSSKSDLREAQLEGQQAVDQVATRVNHLNAVLSAPETISLAQDSDGVDALLAHLQGKVPEASMVQLFAVDQIDSLDPDRLGPNGYAVLDMLLSIRQGLNPLLQIHQSAEPPALFVAHPVQAGEELQAVMLVELNPGYITAGFQPSFDALGFVRLSQYNGRQRAAHLAEFGDPAMLGEIPDRIPVGGSTFRVEFPQQVAVVVAETGFLLLVLLLGLITLVAFWVLRASNERWQLQQDKDEAARQRAAVKIVRKPPPGAAAEPEAAAVLPSEPSAAPLEHRPDSEPKPDDKEQASDQQEEQLPEPPPLTLHYDIAERRKERESEHTPVDLLPEIFRAYDIRGVIDKTLDSGVAHQVGQVIGTLALEADAAPVVVARDGRLSGPYLMDGMIDGITSAGCDVLDIGAVPTGVLYYATHEKANGSGVMITGSHNPPDYNGFKVTIGGMPLHGDAVSDIYRRITEGDIRSGSGQVSRQNVVDDYIERIASDIKVERPLKVVIDCGNGIGGVCAAETLRALGVEVLPLFDEVDGTFPNHHPDPSEPENLQDLIASVRLMEADLGLALDGDADRLGVVTHGGEIIYPDRVMMLLAIDVLDRNPGATIIYDVKCTGHLPRVIEEAGGKAVMYKTGHSLIKAYMKELGSPFAGEMSGHFFFEERWYGVDDGIYAAARLLEILGGTETPPEAILSALPSSVSTPELKVQMSEGENHAFIEEFRATAKFEQAEINIIDGLRADWKDGWGLVRASNTTPILVVRFDAETEEALERIKGVFRRQMIAVNPNLELPF